MENFKEKESVRILGNLADLIENVKSRAVQSGGLALIVEEGREFHENRDAMAGLGAGIQRMLVDIEELSDQIEAGIKELRERCSPRQNSQTFASNKEPIVELSQ